MRLNSSLNRDDKLYKQIELDSNKSGFAIWNTNGNLLYANQTLKNWAKEFNYSLYKAKKISDLLATPHRIYYETHLFPLLKLNGCITEINLQLQFNDVRIPILLSAEITKSPLEDGQEIIKATLFRIQERDRYEKELLFERRRAEEGLLKLKNKNDQLEEFARILVHDLRAPLTNIYSLCEVYSSDYSSNDDKAKFINHIFNASKQLIQLIDDLLHYYRTVTDYFDNINRIDIKTFLTDLFHLYSKPNIELKLLTNLDSIAVNEIALKQILMNLISNAIHYNNKEKTIITISCGENDDFYDFRVKDNGIGIPQTIQKRVFDLFTSIQRDGTKRKEKGSGLGLAICKKIVLQAQGEISIRSEENLFTEFRFTLKKPLIA